MIAVPDHENVKVAEISLQIQVKGYRIEEKTDAKKSELSSSGLKWTILAAVFLAIALFGAGCLRKKR